MWKALRVSGVCFASRVRKRKPSVRSLEGDGVSEVFPQRLRLFKKAGNGGKSVFPVSQLYLCIFPSLHTLYGNGERTWRRARAYLGREQFERLSLRAGSRLYHELFCQNGVSARSTRRVRKTATSGLKMIFRPNGTGAF